MRITQTLCQQHIYQMFKKHWKIQGVRIPRDNGSLKACDESGIKYENPLDQYKRKFEKITVEAERPNREKKIRRDETHPLWNSRPCFIYGDLNVLVNGLDQAQVLAKTQIYDALPKRIQEAVNNVEISPETDRNIKNATLNAHLFDSEQEKLPKIKDSLRPAWNFKRVYGISDHRKCRLIIAKLLSECEKLSGFQLSNERKVSNNRQFVVSFEKENIFYQFGIHAETFLSSKKPIDSSNLAEGLSPISSELPDLFPMACNISIPEENIYNIQDVYPILNESKFSQPHTIFLHFSTTDVANLYEKPVIETQEHARALLKTFTVAASRARSAFGTDVKELPKPIIVQSVQVAGNSLRFGVFQLNTLDLNGTDGTRNFWFSAPPIALYSQCEYIESRPILTEFNSDVLKHTLAFYKNN